MPSKRLNLESQLVVPVDTLSIVLTSILVAAWVRNSHAKINFALPHDLRQQNMLIFR